MNTPDTPDNTRGYTPEEENEDEETRVYTVEDYGFYGDDLQDATRPYPAGYSTAQTSPVVSETEPTRPYERTTDETLPLNPELNLSAEGAVEDATRIIGEEEENQQSADPEPWHAPVGHTVPSLAELGHSAKMPAPEPAFTLEPSDVSAPASAPASTSSAVVPAAPATYTPVYPVQTMVPTLVQGSLVMGPGRPTPLVTAQAEEQSQRARNLGLISMLCCVLVYLFFPRFTGLTSIVWLTALVTSICAISIGHSASRRGAKSRAGVILGWIALCISVAPLFFLILGVILLIIFVLSGGSMP